MKVALLTSGFPKGFTHDFVNCISRYYDGGTLLFVASDFKLHETTDKYSKIFATMFEDAGIEIDDFHVLDSRTPSDEAKKLIAEAGIVWLSGGDTLKQISHIKEHGLVDAIKAREGLTIGISAGSINMAKKVVVARDIGDNIPELSIYEGLGLVDVNIEPHLDSADDDHLNDVLEASNTANIYGLYDNSFIEVVGDEKRVYGKHVKYVKC